LSKQAELDIAYVREQFPGLKNGWAFMDNAGGTQILARAVERMNDFLFNKNVQIGGSYDISLQAAAALQSGREAIATLVNASRPEEIVFAPTSTTAMQNLARSMRGQLKEGDEIIVTVSDHESNIGPWVSLQEIGVQIKFWDLDKESLELKLEDLDKLMTERTKLVAVTHVSNILGTINPVGEIADFVHARGALICVDCVAYAPHRAIDVQAWDVDFLGFSLYKVYGPHGAVLYGKYELLAELDNLYHYFYGKDKVPAKLEPGNASYELAYSTTGIVEYLSDLGARSGAGDSGAGDSGSASVRDNIELAFDLITDHENKLAESLLSYLRGRKDCRIIGIEDGYDARRVPTISFKVEGRDAGEICQAMDKYHIAIRFGDFHARRLLEYLDLADNSGVVRVSFAHYNTLDEVDELVAALEEILG
jgi:cysteine desulfurase family protein (TIGR01976 family)